MLMSRQIAIASIMLSAALAGSASAQAKPPAGKACEVDEGRPSDVAKAYLAIAQAVGNQNPKPGEVPKALAGAVKGLANGNDNPVGRAYEMGKALVLWSVQPDIPLTTKRGTLGFEKNPDGMIDLPVAIDSAFTIVEKAMPECKADIKLWRSQKVWINLINGALGELNADQLDSAEVHANRSLVLNHDSPYAFMVLGQVASRRNPPKTEEAIRLYQKTIDLSGTDSTYNDVKRSTLVNLANLAANAAEEEKDPAAKAKLVAQARTSYQAIIAMSPAGHPYAESASSGLDRLDIAAGDTAAVRARYAPMCNNSSAFTFNQLLQGGTRASQVKDTPCAIKLFEGAYEKNPYHRDALRNLAIMYVQGKEFDKAIPLYKRLLEIDPNGDNGHIGVFVYGGIGQRWAEANKAIVARFNASKATETALRKTLTDSATITADSNRFYIAIAVDLNTQQDSQFVKVNFTEFTNVGDKVTLGGSIMNNSAAPKTFPMSVEFLDKTGKVVATQQASVGPVAPQSSGRFTVTATAPGIVAFKYAKLN